MIQPDKDILAEIEGQRPKYPVSLLSRQEKDRLIERGVVGLYRWYTTRSQKKRNWHPDGSFDWRNLRTDHSPELNTLVEGFYAIEQYVPDYVSKLTHLVRESHGRSHFQIRWGAEEERHADTWRNALIFLRHRTPEWVDEYGKSLLTHEWMLEWDDPLRMILYAVLQERATQLNYLTTAAIARGNAAKVSFANGADVDPVLAKVAETIAVDEAAHYSFFLEVARLYLYYYPQKTIEAFVEVINHFSMPALEFLPDDSFYELIYRTGIFGPREFARDTLQVVLNSLGLKGRKALEKGIRKSREVPDPDGNLVCTAVFDGLDYQAVEDGVRRLFGRIEKYEQGVGFDEVDPTRFVLSGLAPS